MKIRIKKTLDCYAGRYEDEMYYSDWDKIGDYELEPDTILETNEPFIRCFKPVQTGDPHSKKVLRGGWYTFDIKLEDFVKNCEIIKE